jgi:hypothetical protein
MFEHWNSFSLETSLSVEECLQKLQGHIALPPDKLRQWGMYEVQVTSIDETDATFCLNVSTSHAPPILFNFWTATAHGKFVGAGGSTIIEGYIQHGRWVWVNPPLALLFLCFGTLMMCAEPVKGILMTLASLFIFGIAYFHPRQVFRNLLLGTLQWKLEAHPYLGKKKKRALD